MTLPREGERMIWRRARPYERQEAQVAAGSGPVRISWSRALIGPTPEQLFEMVSDIESYPRFVPGCVETRIVKREEKRWIVENVFGLGPVRTHFTSIATFATPEALDIRSVDGPWRQFDMGWRFRPTDTGCHVTCTTAFDFQSPVLARVATMGSGAAQAAVVEAFLQRAKTLYGARA